MTLNWHQLENVCTKFQRYYRGVAWLPEGISLPPKRGKRHELKLKAKPTTINHQTKFHLMHEQELTKVLPRHVRKVSALHRGPGGQFSGTTFGGRR